MLPRRLLLVAMAVLALVAFNRATCGRVRPEDSYAVEATVLRDEVHFHNVGITWDGRYYYTVNGGNEEYSTLNRYDARGTLAGTYDVGLDGRAIFHNPRDKGLYVKNFGTSLYRIDLDRRRPVVALAGVFEHDNSSVGFAPDGSRIYEFVQGTVRVLDFETGDEVERLDLPDYREDDGHDVAIAASRSYLYVWGHSGTVHVYTLRGELVNTLDLPQTGFWGSLSWCRGRLWIAEDADANTGFGYGTWYGFQLKGLE